jgi:hypothetical protein
LKPFVTTDLHSGPSAFLDTGWREAIVSAQCAADNEAGAVTRFREPSLPWGMGNDAKSFQSNKNEASKKKPPPTIPLIVGVDVLKET